MSIILIIDITECYGKYNYKGILCIVWVLATALPRQAKRQYQFNLQVSTYCVCLCRAEEIDGNLILNRLIHMIQLL